MAQRQTPNLTADEALVYEEFFVAAPFGQWAGRVAGAAPVQPGQRVLDVACGTGVLARAVADQVGPAGSVGGLDLNEGMLARGCPQSPGIAWRRVAAESLPFRDGAFDAIVSQFGLMFFKDPSRAIREMLRVLRPGGRAAVAVCDALDHVPAYVAFVALLQRLFGNTIADNLRAPFALGDPRILSSMFADAGAPSAAVTTHDGTARFPSLDSCVRADAKGWLQLDDHQLARLLDEAENALRAFVTAEGTVTFSRPAHIVTATKG